MTGLMLVWMLTASAQQRQVDITRGQPEWTFDIRWRDADGKSHRTQFSLPHQPVRADLDEPFRYRKKEAARMAAQAVRAFGETRPNVDVRARVSDDGTLYISASGSSRSRVRAVLEAAEAVRDEALAQYQQENGWSTLDGSIIPDHVGHASTYADALQPVVEALGGPTPDPRDFANTALGFVQSIPYEQRVVVRDRFRRPLSVLGRNKGDCDSKSTLYLGLIRAAYPTLPLAMVYIPNHAYVALGLDAERGEDTLRDAGMQWVLAEPVGPALHPVGEISGRSRRKSRFGRAEMLIVDLE